MQAGSKIHGFTVKRVRELTELSANLWEMEHEIIGDERNERIGAHQNGDILGRSTSLDKF